MFDTSDAQLFLEKFIEQYELDTRLIGDVQTQIRDDKDDDEITTDLLSRSPYRDAGIPEDALSEDPESSGSDNGEVSPAAEIDSAAFTE